MYGKIFVGVIITIIAAPIAAPIVKFTSPLWNFNVPNEPENIVPNETGKINQLVAIQNPNFDALKKEIQAGNLDKVICLIDKAKVIEADAMGSDNRKPLHIAVESEHLKIVEFLVIEEGAFTHPQDNNGNTPLHVAVNRKNLEIINLLAEKGADITIKNNKGQTPLDLAEGNKKIKAILRGKCTQLLSWFWC